MRKHNLLLSLLALLFAVFMTACESNSSSSAKTTSPDNIGGAGDTPSLSISASKLGSGKSYHFTGTLLNADPNAYTWTWNFGDGDTSSDVLETTHEYADSKTYNVELILRPIDSGAGLNTINATATVSASLNGTIIGTDVRTTPTSDPMRYTFTARAETTDGSALTWTWKVNDEIVEGTTNVLEYTFQKYNTTYKVVPVAKSATDELELPMVEITTPQLNAYLNISNTSQQLVKDMTVTFDSVNANSLDNVTYEWDFGDDNITRTVSNTVTHTYPTDAAAKTYKVTVSITSNSFDGKIVLNGQANTESTFIFTNTSYTVSGDDKLTYNYSVTGSGGTENQQITYKFHFPDAGAGVYEDVPVSVGSDKTSTATKSHTYVNYLKPYTVTVIAYADGQEVGSVVISHNAPDPNYAFGETTDGSSYFEKTFVLTSDYTFAGASYRWNFGDQSGEVTTNEPTATHTFNSTGTKTVTVKITNSRGVAFGEITLVTTVTINANLNVGNINCVNQGQNTKFLQYNCSLTASASNGNVVYKWYLGNDNGGYTLINDATGNNITRTFDAYGKSYNIKAEVSIENVTNVAAVTKTYTVTTPVPTLVIEGPDNGLQGETLTYNAYTVVEGVRVDLTGATYNWQILESNSNPTGNSYSNTQTIKHLFNPNLQPGQQIGRIVKATVTATNLSAAVTNTKNVVITAPPVSLEDIQTAVVSCTSPNAFNKVRQNCTVTLTPKSGKVEGFNASEFSAEITANNTKKTVNFTSGNTSSSAQYDFEWPSTIVTGKSVTANTYTVTAKVYKKGEPGNTINATNATVSVSSNNVDYVLFPNPSGITDTRNNTWGGSGSRLSTFSCGYNEVYGQGNATLDSNCSATSNVSGQTLALGNFVGPNGNMLKTVKARWGYRLQKNDGSAAVTGYIGDNITLSEGTAPANIFTFDFADSFNSKGLRYTGSAYNSSDANNIFFLEITSDNKDILAKPYKVWYNGTNKTGNGNRLQFISPLSGNGTGGTYCNVSQTQGNSWTSAATVTIYVKRGEYYLGKTTFAGLLPTGENNKPKLHFTTKTGINNGSGSATFAGDVSANLINGDWGTGWYYQITAGTYNYYYKSTDKYWNISGHQSTTMGFSVKNMLNGSNGYRSDLYRTVTCGYTPF